MRNIKVYEKYKSLWEIPGSKFENDANIENLTLALSYRGQVTDTMQIID